MSRMGYSLSSKRQVRRFPSAVRRSLLQDWQKLCVTEVMRPKLPRETLPSGVMSFHSLAGPRS